MKRLSLLPLFLLAACAGDDVSTDTDTSALQNPTLGPQVGSVRLVMNGFEAFGGEALLDGCHGTIVAPAWIVTAAHCFDDFNPAQGVTIDIDPLGVQLDETRVIFHPEAFGDGDETWDEPRSGAGSLDIALVHLLDPVPDASVAPLWNPGWWQGQPIDGHEVIVSGFDEDFFTGGRAAGTQTIVDVVTFADGVTVLEASASPTPLMSGDSGGGDYFDIDDGLTAAPHGRPCLPPAVAAGGRGLAAINKLGGSTNQLVPLFTSQVRPWLLDHIDDDLDNDGVCDTDDNCPAVANDQANCNVLAERSDGFLGSHIELGDACDPVPCPEPSLTETDIEYGESGWPYIVPGGGPKLYLCTSTAVRRLNGAVTLTPRAGAGSSVTSAATPRFCSCRDAAGVAIEDPDTCAGAPHYCELDVAEALPGVIEVGATGAPGPIETYWHRMDIGAPSVMSISYPGSPTTRTWDFAADHADWVAQGWITTLPQDPDYPSGTDLAGMLWAHDPTGVGRDAHDVGFCTGDGCNLADGFATGVAADPKGTAVSCRRLPWLKPAPWWTYCARCGDEWLLPGEEVSNPAPLITVDPESGAVFAFANGAGYDATLLFDKQLKARLGDASLRWLGSPRDLGHAFAMGEPRAIAVAANGTRVLGVAKRDDRTFGWSEIESGGDGPSARSGFAAAVAGPLVVIAGGLDASGRALDDVWTWSASHGWTSAALPRGTGPTQALAAAYGHADHQLWIVHDTRTGRRLLRVDATTGVVASSQRFTALDGLTALSIVALPSGELIVAGNDREGGHTLVRLREAGRRVELIGLLRDEGVLATPIALHRGMIQRGMLVTDVRAETEVLVNTELSPDAVE